VSRLGKPGRVRQRNDLARFREYERRARCGNALIAQKACQIDRGEIGAHDARGRSIEAAAQCEARLAASGENVEIAPLDHITALCGIVPGALTGIELGALAAPDDGAIVGEECPLCAAAAVRIGGDDLVGKTASSGAFSALRKSALLSPAIWVTIKNSPLSKPT
jgi:hypothetical protein